MLPADVDAAVEAIRRDNTSGASVLVRRAAEALAVLGADPPIGVTAAAGRALMAAQPAMAPMVNLAHAAVWAAERGEPVDAACAGFLARMDQNTASAARHVAAPVQTATVVLTHSYSATVRDGLLAAARAGQRFAVICTESRPMREGAQLARTLAEAGVPVTLVVDAAMWAALERVDLVLVGADSVSERGVVNKMGTALLASAAQIRQIRCYAVCTSEKVLPPGYPEREQVERPHQEVEEDMSAGLQVENYYFDRTPLDRLTGLVTEAGVQTLDQIRRTELHPLLLE